MLTVSDLKKIEELIDYKLEEKLEEKLDEKLAPLKDTIGNLQDVILEMHHFMCTEFRLLQKRVENTSKTKEVKFK